MKLIAHRGNFEKANPEKENNPEYISVALKAGYDIEIDVWMVDSEMWLGHNHPQYRLNYGSFMELLKNPGVWWHAKNYKALDYMLTRWPHTKTFAHETDAYGIVNGGYIWTVQSDFLGLAARTIVMIPDSNPRIVESVFSTKVALGMCCDDFRGLKND